jgi:hypothetical protein
MTIHQIEARLARLEKSSRRWKLATLSLLLLAIAAASFGGVILGGDTGGMSAPKVTADNLIANRSISLNDSNGKPRIVLTVDAADNPGIVLKDKDDHVLMKIATEKDEARILIQDAKGKKLFAAP